MRLFTEPSFAETIRDSTPYHVERGERSSPAITPGFFQHETCLYCRPLKKLISGIKAARERHKERHRPTGFEFALADSIHFLNAQHWDATTASAGFFLRRTYLSVLERCCPEGLRMRYGLIYSQGEPKAAVVAQISARGTPRT